MKTYLRIVGDISSGKVLILDGDRLLGDLTPSDAIAFAKLVVETSQSVSSFYPPKKEKKSGSD